LVFGASTRREKGEDRVVELLLALRDSQTISLRVPSHVEVGARRPPGSEEPLTGTPVVVLEGNKCKGINRGPEAASELLRP
jgi:hypothetical protein